jgi:hypothetical protein
MEVNFPNIRSGTVRNIQNIGMIKNICEISVTLGANYTGDVQTHAYYVPHSSVQEYDVPLSNVHSKRFAASREIMCNFACWNQTQLERNSTIITDIIEWFAFPFLQTIYQRKFLLLLLWEWLGF